MDQKDAKSIKLLAILLAVLVAFMVLIILAANLIGGRTEAVDISADSRVQAAIEARIKPIGQLNTGAAGAAPVVAAAVDGKSVYDSACMACHATGAAGAPKMGDKPAWSARIAQGMDVLNKHAIEGFQGSAGYMPARGGRGDLSDEAVIAAVKYMIENSK